MIFDHICKQREWHSWFDAEPILQEGKQKVKQSEIVFTTADEKLTDWALVGIKADVEHLRIGKLLLT